MMVAQSDLFDLIKSLSASEKRYFKLYAAAIGGKEASSYMKLFNFIDKMNSFDDNLIKKKFKNERFIKQLSVLKNYLLHLIIKSLLHSKEDVYNSSSLQLQVASIQLLFEKGLNKLCLKTIKKLKEIAWQQEDFLIIDKLCDWEVRIVMCDLQTALAIEKTKEQINAVKKRLADLEMKREALMLLPVQKNSTIESPDNRKLISATKKIENRIDKIEQGGILSRYYYHTSLNISYGILSNSDKRFYHAAEALRQLEQNKHFLEANLRLYISLIYNYSNSLLANQQYEILNDFLKEKSKIIENIDNNYSEAGLMGNTILLNVEILLYINGYYEKLHQNTIETGKKLVHEGQKFSNGFHVAELCKNLIHALFIEKEYNEALYFVNEILNNKKYKYVSFIYLQTRLWELILHHELNNFILLKNLGDTALRYLQKEKQLLPFDSKLIQFLKTEEPAKQVILSKELLKLYKENEKKQTVFSLLQNNIVFEKWLEEK